LFYVRPAVLGNAEYGVTGGTVLLVCLLTVNVFAGWVLSELVEVPMQRRLCPKAPPADSTPGGARPVHPVPRSTAVTMVRWPVVARLPAVRPAWAGGTDEYRTGEYRTAGSSRRRADREGSRNS
ncbi:MAG TPA: hypothetical protein VFM37_16920, partial [Pseudonocardiaceae bacterium]|nr:hypothetical protein [Pseudonocardiaceae bacterium]